MAKPTAKDIKVDSPYKKLEHPCFAQPKDDSIRVWRYLNLAKLVWLLENQKLYLSRLDLLEDSHEGSLPNITASQYYSEHLYHAFDINRKRLINEFGEEEGTLKFQEMVPNILRQLEQVRSHHQEDRRHYFVNCWNMSNSESEAMWRLYCSDNNGIAIQTTYKKLVESTLSDKNLFIGCINYIDYESHSFPMDNVFYKLMHKRISFAHEQEVRIIKTLTPQSWGTPQEVCLKGFELDWLVESIVDTIHVNPYAPNYFFDVVRNVVKRTFPQLEERVVWSKMRAAPQY